MIAAVARQRAAGPHCAPKSPNIADHASYTRLTALNGLLGGGLQPGGLTMRKFEVTVGFSSPDVAVRFEDGSTGRPIMIGISDAHSRKVLVSRVGADGPALAREAYADLVRQHGVPTKVTMDDGRVFASRTLTGGAAAEFRFKIKDADTGGRSDG